jgi:hypothetical protein
MHTFSSGTTAAWHCLSVTASPDLRCFARTPLTNVLKSVTRSHGLTYTLYSVLPHQSVTQHCMLHKGRSESNNSSIDTKSQSWNKQQRETMSNTLSKHDMQYHCTAIDDSCCVDVHYI